MLRSTSDPHPVSRDLAAHHTLPPVSFSLVAVSSSRLIAVVMPDPASISATMSLVSSSNCSLSSTSDSAALPFSSSLFSLSSSSHLLPRFILPLSYSCLNEFLELCERWVRRLWSAHPLIALYLPKPTFISDRAVCRSITFSASSCFCCSFSLSSCLGRRCLPFSQSPPLSVVAVLSLSPPLIAGYSLLVCVPAAAS